MDSDHAPDRGRPFLAALVGMLAIVALPLSAVVLPVAGDDVGRIGVSLLTFATPATFFVAGRLRARAWMMSLAVTLAIVLLPVVVLGAFTGLALLSIFVGPLVAGVAVGLLLRDLDTAAAAGFYGGGTIAVIGGFAAAPAGPGAAAAVVLTAAVLGLGVTWNRLGRDAAT